MIVLPYLSTETQLRRYTGVLFSGSTQSHRRSTFYGQVKNAHRVDLTATLKGLTIHCKEESPDMYASIDSVSTALQSKLSKYRQRRNDGYHAGNRMGDDLMEALEQADFEEVESVKSDDFVDPEEPNVLKVSSYDLENAIPIKEAIFALDYVDHDFFVFKNEETGKKSVVYKRNAGGIGLIEL
jgi:putative sigma-54 modulation protein